MKKEVAWQIMQKNQLISGKISRTILQAIINGGEIKKDALPANVSLSEIQQLQRLYQKKLIELHSQINQTPKYLPFYFILREKIPNFSWKRLNTTKPLVELKAPRVDNLRPSLLSLLLDRVDSTRDTLLHRKYICVNQLPLVAIQILESFLAQCEAIYPAEEEMALIVEWLLRGLAGEKLTIFLPICPDYSVETTGNAKYPYRHTFKELGFGNGQVAQRILSALPFLKEVLDKLNLKNTIVAGLGDFEAFSDINLRLFNLTEQAFLARVESSRQAFERMCPVKVQVAMITDFCKGKEQWLSYFKLLENKFAKGDFGCSQLTEEKLLYIVEKRKPFYSRWYGEKPSLKDYIPIAINQGIEYATAGAIVTNAFKNCLILGADNDVMRFFYSASQRIPTLYLKRFYC